MKNIKWCLDTLDEMNSESGAFINEQIYDRLVAAYKELETFEYKPTQGKITKEQVIETLKRLNAWRRGADIPQPEPVLIGRAIDEAIKLLEEK
jgi:hypothetical protein